jgi:hypothetical protein
VIVVVWRADTSAYANLEKLRAGDFDLNGVTGLSDFSILKAALNKAGVVIPHSVVRL